MQTTHEPERAGDTERAQGAEEHAWLSNLVRELFQTEQSAKDHPLIEAERLGDVPPAHALRAISAHAETALAELPALVKRHHLPLSGGGKAVGAAFSSLRDNFADLLLSMEKSYRGTLLGMRHGVDLVELVQYVARAEGDVDLAMWCATWLEKRRALVDAAARELAWFAANPERAREAAKDNPLALGLQALVNGFEQIAVKLREVVPPKE